MARSRLVTLTGPAGCGKTRLAFRVAEGLLGVYPEGVWLVDCVPPRRARPPAPPVAAVLGVREEPGRRLEEMLGSATGARGGGGSRTSSWPLPRQARTGRERSTGWGASPQALETTGPPARGSRRRWPSSRPWETPREGARAHDAGHHRGTPGRLRVRAQVPRGEPLPLRRALPEPRGRLCPRQPGPREGHRGRRRGGACSLQGELGHHPPGGRPPGRGDRPHEHRKRAAPAGRVPSRARPWRRAWP